MLPPKKAPAAKRVLDKAQALQTKMQGELARFRADPSPTQMQRAVAVKAGNHAISINNGRLNDRGRLRVYNKAYDKLINSFVVAYRKAEAALTLESNKATRLYNDANAAYSSALLEDQTQAQLEIQRQADALAAKQIANNAALAAIIDARVTNNVDAITSVVEVVNYNTTAVDVNSQRISNAGQRIGLNTSNITNNAGAIDANGTAITSTSDILQGTIANPTVAQAKAFNITSNALVTATQYVAANNAPALKNAQSVLVATDLSLATKGNKLLSLSNTLPSVFSNITKSGKRLSITSGALIENGNALAVENANVLASANALAMGYAAPPTPVTPKNKSVLAKAGFAALAGFQIGGTAGAVVGAGAILLSQPKGA